MTLSDALARVVRLCEALADDDLAFLRQGLGDLAADLEKAVRQRGCACPECGLSCEWPGLLDEHLRVSHPEAWEASVAA